MFFLCATVSAYVIGKNPKLLERFRTMVGADERALKSSRIAAVSAHHSPVSILIPKAILAPSVTYEDADFSLASSFGQEDFCQLVGAQLPSLDLGWKQSPLSAGSSDCDGFAGSAGSATNGMTNSLFIQIRRSRSGEAWGIRLKMVDLPQSQGQGYRSEFEKAAETILQRIYAAKLDYVFDKLTKLEPFTETRQGISVELSKEVLFEGAYNLTIRPVCGKFNCPANGRFYTLSSNAGLEGPNHTQ